MKKLSGILFAAILGAASAASAAPETVHVTYHVQAGKLDDLLEAVARQFPAGRRAGIMLASPHVVLAGKEDGGKPVVVEIFTWRDEDDADDVSTKYPEIMALWKRMNALVEKRGGKPGIEIDAMDLVGSAPGRREEEGDRELADRHRERAAAAEAERAADEARDRDAREGRLTKGRERPVSPVL